MVERETAIGLGIAATLITMMIVFVSQTNKAEWHIIKISEDNTVQYAIEDCHKYLGCDILGYRDPVTPEGLASITKTYNFFIDPEPKVLQVIK